MIYFVKCLNPDSPRYRMVKIGTTRRLSIRLYELRQANGQIELLGTYPGGRAEESALHRQFAEYRAEGREWFAHKGRLIWFIKKHATSAVIEEPVSPVHVPPRPAMNKTVNVCLWDVLYRHYGNEWPPVENIADMVGVRQPIFKAWLCNDVSGINADAANKVCAFFRLKSMGELIQLGKKETA